MTQKPTTDSETLDREFVPFWTRIRRGALLMIGVVVLYLLLTGPLLWSVSKVENDVWQSFVKLAIKPIITIEAYEKREYVESLNASQSAYSIGAFCVMIDPPPDDSWWLSGLHYYWNLYGFDTNLSYLSLSFSNMLTGA